METSVELGVVLGAHGIKGALSIRFHNPDSAVLKGNTPVNLWLCKGKEEYRSLRYVSHRGSTGIFKVSGISDRNEAETLRGGRLLAERNALQIGEGEYLYSELIGCQVHDEGQLRGTVTRVFFNGSHDVLVVSQAQECTERWVPFVAQWISAVDVAEKQIVIAGEAIWPTVPKD